MNEIANPIKIDHRPLYTRAIESLKEMFESGHYEPGDRLPSEEVLAKQLGISRSTLREAMGYLETQGLISRRQGIGTFVTAPVKSGFQSGLERLESFRSLAAMAGLTPGVEEREVGLVQANAKLAAALGLETGAELIRIQVVEAVNDQRSLYLDTYIPAYLANVDDLVMCEESVIAYLCKQSECGLSHTRSEIFAVEADKSVAAKLEVPQGKSILHLAETYYSRAGKPIALSMNYFLTKTFHFYIVRRVVTSQK